MRWAASYAVWAGWLAAFLILELSGLWRWVPWVTLSETSWHLEEAYPVLYTLLGGFLLGLNVHIVFHIPFWRAMLFGLIVAVAAHICRPSWP